jgi:ABC-type enterochelin transport system substrate-binding protein
MNKPKKMGFFTWLANLLGLGNKENSTSKTFKGQQSFNNETISTAPDESVDISDIISENFQKSNKMALVHNFQPDNNLSPKKTTRSFEEIGLLFGLANKANEKQTYLDSM